MERSDAEYPQLLTEFRILKEMETKSFPGFPSPLWFAVEKGRNLMVMTLLGKSLEGYRHTLRNGKVPVSRLVPIGIQILHRLEALHSCGFAYRDIKPENFLFDKHGLVYVVDFGLCKRVVSPRNGEHIQFRSGRVLTGTPNFAAVNLHRGIEPSRRDDIEAFVNMMVFLAKGSLPWPHEPDEDDPCQWTAMGDAKSTTDPQRLCSGLPLCVLDTLLHARTLEFQAMPDYGFLFGVWDKAWAEIAKRSVGDSLASTASVSASTVRS